MFAASILTRRCRRHELIVFASGLQRNERARHSIALLEASWKGREKTRAMQSLLRLDPGRLNDRPPFLGIGFLQCAEGFWRLLFAPKGTPTAVVGKLNAAAVEALADPIVRSRLVDLGFEIFPREKETPEALAAMQKADARKWWPIIKEFGIKAE